MIPQLESKRNSRPTLSRMGSGILLMVSIVFSAILHASPVARITASRLSGPAPLAVFFDATGTTDSNTQVDSFRQHGYRFNFGDPGAGTWVHSGLQKNEQIGGPLAAHVFQSAGTYSVRVTVRDSSGSSSEASVSVTVTSPDQTFAGVNTVCMSRTSDFTGCPANAQLVSNASNWPTFQSSKRYLLRSGQDFVSLGAIGLGQGAVSGVQDFQLDSFGAGAKPRVAHIDLYGSKDPVVGNRGRPERVSISNLDTSGIQIWYGSADVLFLRNYVGRGGTIYLGSIFTYELGLSSSNGWQVPFNNFVVENDIGTVDESGDYGITGMATRLAIMGNAVDKSGYHNIRIGQGHKVLISHNRLLGHTGIGTGQALKLHASGTAANSLDVSASQAFRQRSSEIVVSNNLIGAADNTQNWLAAVAPQNNVLQEGVERVIAEDNRFIRGPTHSLDLYFVGRNVTERGNFNTTTNATTTFFAAGNGSALPQDWIGPYYFGQPSMRLLFSDNLKIPLSPVLSVQ